MSAPLPGTPAIHEGPRPPRYICPCHGWEFATWAGYGDHMELTKRRAFADSCCGECLGGTCYVDQVLEN